MKATLILFALLSLLFMGTALGENSGDKELPNKQKETLPEPKVYPYFKAKKECQKKLGKKASKTKINDCIRKKQGIQFTF